MKPLTSQSKAMPSTARLSHTAAHLVDRGNHFLGPAALVFSLPRASPNREGFCVSLPKMNHGFTWLICTIFLPILTNYTVTYGRLSAVPHITSNFAGLLHPVLGVLLCTTSCQEYQLLEPAVALRVVSKEAALHPSNICWVFLHPAAFFLVYRLVLFGIYPQPLHQSAELQALFQVGAQQSHQWPN